jgi:hypothetical protein
MASETPAVSETPATKWRRKHLVLAAGLGFVIAAAFLWYGIASPAKAAARSLAAINSLSAGETTESELLSRPEFQRIERTCMQENCFYHMEAENTLLSKLHLAPRTFMSASVTVRDGLVVGVSVFLFRANRPAIVLSQVQKMPPDCHKIPCVKLLVPPNKILMSISILFDSQSDLRNHVPEAVNTRCLAQFHGCTRYAELMPLVKQLNLEETSTGEVKLRD